MTLSPAKAHHPPTKKCSVSGWHVCPVYRVLGRSTTPIPKKRVKPRKEVVAKTNEAYREWIRGHWCELSGAPASMSILHRFPGQRACEEYSRAADGRPSEAAHLPRVRQWGDDGNLIPLCPDHHREQHRIGIKTFQERYGIDLKAKAAAYWDSYQLSLRDSQRMEPIP